MTENPDEPIEVRPVLERDFDAIGRAMPDWLEKRERPPWIQEWLWKSFIDEIKEDILNDEEEALQAWLLERPSRKEWSQETITETVELHYRGPSESGQVAEHPMLPLDYGRGVAGVWEEFQANNANAAQYLNLNKILGSGFPAAHFNLCGELAVCGVMGFDLVEGLNLFMQVRPTDKSTEVLKTGSTSFGSQLAGLIHLCSDGALKAAYRTANFAPQLKISEPTQMLDMLNSGRMLIPLVNIGKGSGLLRPVSSNARLNIAHWVGVLDVMRLRQGNYVVRIYNSYHNHEEFYTWSTFLSAWEQTQGNSSRFGVVLAEPV